MALVHAENLEKDYRSGDLVVHAIRGVGFKIEAASFVSFVGPSGSGKSTLLNMIGCMDRPTAGRLTVMGTDVSALTSHEAAAFRAESIGFLFQSFNLIPVLSAYENVEYPLIMVRKWPSNKRRQQVQYLLEAVGLAELAHKRPDQLSGGEQQRVAIARALVTNPQLVLADEPTGNLDHQSGCKIVALMRRLRDELGTTFLFSTHDPKIMAEAEVIYFLEDGLLHPGKISTRLL
jgi:putative ABC transport system ATP-binding protein